MRRTESNMHTQVLSLFETARWHHQDAAVARLCRGAILAEIIKTAERRGCAFFRVFDADEEFLISGSVQ